PGRDSFPTRRSSDLLVLPALSQQQASEAPQPQQETLEKVLIVDDQPDVLEVTCELFRSLGFEVLTANSGEDAVQVLQRTPDIHLDRKSTRLNSSHDQ